MTTRTILRFSAWVVLAVGCVWPRAAAEERLPESDALMQALVAELDRALQLQMEDLERPYFVQFNVDDSIIYTLSAAHGALTAAERDRSRTLYSQIRVGGPELDNTNFVESGGFRFAGGDDEGGQASLPIDDDYLALRQAIWRAADARYKQAVETLTKKRAYMKDKNIVDRPADFSAAPTIEKLEPTAVLRFDQAQWESHLARITAAFKQYTQVQDASARLIAAAGNSYIVNSEGTRLRTGESAVLLLLSATVQAEDGMRLSGSRSYAGRTTDELPAPDAIVRDVEGLVAELTAAMQAPIIEHYAGPVLFDDVAAAQVFRALLAEGLLGKPDPVGEQRRGPQPGESLENKLGTRILPKSYQVWDDPTVDRFGQEPLLGHYCYDDEGVPARRVDLVRDGKLEGLCLSRAPTKKLSGSTGHARRAPGSDEAEPAVGCLFIKDNEAVSADELKAALIAAAKDAGLEYGIRVKSLRAADISSSRVDLLSFVVRIQRGGQMTGLGDPVVAYKVYVADGREEPFRGCAFGPLDVTALKKLLAAGDTPKVYNYLGIGLEGASPPATIVAPPVLFEEVELSKIEQEFDQPPLLAAPRAR